MVALNLRRVWLLSPETCHLVKGSNVSTVPERSAISTRLLGPTGSSTRNAGGWAALYTAFTRLSRTVRALLQWRYQAIRAQLARRPHSMQGSPRLSPTVLPRSICGRSQPTSLMLPLPQPLRAQPQQMWRSRRASPLLMMTVQRYIQLHRVGAVRVSSDGGAAGSRAINDANLSDWGV